MAEIIKEARPEPTSSRDPEQEAGQALPETPIEAPDTLTTPHLAHVGSIGSSGRPLSSVPTVTTALGGTTRTPSPDTTATSAPLK